MVMNKEYHKQYYETNKENTINRVKEWRKNNKEEYNKYHRTYRKKKREKIKEYQKQYRETHKEEINKKQREWGKKNTHRYSKLVYNSKKKNLPISLTKEEYDKLMKETTNCYYCNYLFEEGNTNRHNSKSLDRIDNDKGYELSNVVVCCYLCNGVKSDYFTKEQMLRMGKLINEIRQETT